MQGAETPSGVTGGRAAPQGREGGEMTSARLHQELKGTASSVFHQSKSATP